MLEYKQKWDSDCERKLNLYAEIYLKVGLSDLICVYRFFCCSKFRLRTDSTGGKR